MAYSPPAAVIDLFVGHVTNRAKIRVFGNSKTNAVMPHGHHISELEELALMAVAAIPGEAYGFAVRQLLQADAGRTVSLATIHSSLYRLEEKGLLRSELGGATNARGGRSKRLFSVTSAGIEVIRERRTARERLYRLIPGMG